MKGSWDGFYRYDRDRIREATGFEKTGFTIEIMVFDGINFEGTVNDDTATGGMAETGRIIGTISKNTIRFRKFMPVGSEINPDGTSQKTGKKHKTIYYSGTLSEDGTIINGQWKFRHSIALLFGIIPIPYSPGTGTWGMTKKY